MRRALLVARQWLWCALRQHVRAVLGERGVLAVLHVDRLHVDTRDLGDLIETRLDEVDRHRRIAERCRLLLCLAQGVVRKGTERAPLVLVELAAHSGGQDEVAVRRQLIAARVGVGVHPFELLREVRGGVALVGVDLRLQQCHGHVLRRGFGVVARGIQHLRHRELRAECVRVVHVPDRTLGEALADVTGHTDVACLRDHPGDGGIEGGEAALRRPTGTRAVVVPDRRMAVDHPSRQLRRRTRSIGANHRHHGSGRQHQARVVGLQRRIVPGLDLAGEQLGDVLARQPQVRHALAVDDEVVHEGRTAGGDRHVGIAARSRILGGRPVFRFELERNVRGGEVDRAVQEVLAAGSRTTRVVVDRDAELAHVHSHCVDGIRRPRRAFTRDALEAPAGGLGLRLHPDHGYQCRARDQRAQQSTPSTAVHSGVLPSAVSMRSMSASERCVARLRWRADMCPAARPPSSRAVMNSTSTSIISTAAVAKPRTIRVS